MPGEGARQRVLLSPSAKTDILETLAWSREKFGKQAAARYRRLLDQAIRDIAADPECPGSRERSELGPGIRTYHLYLSRTRARTDVGIVGRPRHLLVYRRRTPGIIDLVRVLHDARDIGRHVPADYFPGQP